MSLWTCSFFYALGASVKPTCSRQAHGDPPDGWGPPRGRETATNPYTLRACGACETDHQTRARVAREEKMMAKAATKRMTTAFEVVETATQKVVHTVKVDPPAEPESSRVLRIEAGMLRNMDRDRFFVREVKTAQA